MAFSDHAQHVIGLNPAHSMDVNRINLVHELLHCCLQASGTEPNAYAKLVAKARQKHGGFTVEEYTVAGLTAPLLAALVDNPDVLAWLLQ